MPCIPLVDELVIANEPAEIDRAGKWLTGHLDRRTLADPVRFRLGLVVEEALTNAVSYAFDEGTAHELLVRLNASDSTVQIEIEDDGKAFNPLEAPHHAPARNLEEAVVGGLGIHLIRSYADECRYRRENGRNILSLIIRNPHREEGN